MTGKISIFVIESYDLTRALYRQTLGEEFEIKGEFKEEADCFKSFEYSPSDIVLMDLKFPYKNAFNFIKKVKSKNPDTKIIILSAVEDEEIMYTALTLGASGYLLKDIDLDVLKDTIRQIHAGKLYFQTKEEIKALL